MSEFRKKKPWFKGPSKKNSQFLFFILLCFVFLFTTFKSSLAADSPPEVSVGPDLRVPMERYASLTGTAFDDGMSASELTYMWSKVSGPGNVYFVSRYSMSTKARFYAEGTYVIRLTVSDGEKTGSDELQVVVVKNKAPVISAGEDKTITLPSRTLELSGTATDEDELLAPMTYRWRLMSGPQPVVFSAYNSLNTTATFRKDAPGTYVIRLKVYDGIYYSTDYVQVIVKPGFEPAVLQISEIPIVMDETPAASCSSKTITLNYSGTAPATEFSAVLSVGPFTIRQTTCESEITNSCTLTIDFMSNEIGMQNANLSIFYFDGTSTKQHDYVVEGSSAVNAAENVLVVYDSNNADSIEVKDYYLTNRPGMKSANVLGIPLPQNNLNLIYGKIHINDFNDIARAEIVDWIQNWNLEKDTYNHPERAIHYIVLVYPFPSRMEGIARIQGRVAYDLKSVATRLSTAMFDLNLVPYPASQYKTVMTTSYDPIPYFTFYKETGFEPFPQSHWKWPGTMALVTHLHMGSKDATLAYIDKLKDVHSKMANPNVLISAEDAGIGGTTYYSEDVGCGSRCTDWFYLGYARHLDLGLEIPLPSSQYRGKATGTTGHFTNVSDVKGYFSWGKNSDLGTNYALDGKVVFSGKSSWFLIHTAESYNGMYYGNNKSLPPELGGYSGSWFQKWFAQTSFGSTNYDYTPVGAVGHTEEPMVSGVNNTAYFVFWERGFSFADAAWLSRSTDAFVAFGDPLVKE